MELEKEPRIKEILKWVSEMVLEGKSLEWLMTKKEKLSRSVANCERSAREIRQYVVNESDGEEEASELVKERKAELVEAIEMQAELEKIVAKQLDEEIAKRLETSNN